MDVTHNSVLIYPHGHFTSDGDFELFDIFDPARHYNVMGTILCPPNRLVYLREEMNRLKAESGRNSWQEGRVQQLAAWSTEFDTQMEMKVGDTGIFRYNAHMSTTEMGNTVEIHGLNRKLLLIDYDQFYLVMRGDEKVMLNGWLLIEPIEFTKESLDRYFNGMPKDLKHLKIPGMGIVRHIGSKNKGYRDYPNASEPEVSIGDVVLFRHTNAVAIEWRYHKVLNKGKHPYYRMQRKDILAIGKKLVI